MTFIKADWKWDKLYHYLYDWAKALVKEDICIIFCDAGNFLHLEKGASVISLDTGMLEVRDGMNCTSDGTLDNTILRPKAYVSKRLSHDESNIEKHEECFIDWKSSASTASQEK